MIDCWDFYQDGEKAEFSQLKRELRLFDGVRFNLERGKRKSMQGMVVDARLSGEELFGDGWWSRDELQRNIIVHSLLKDDEATVREKAVRDWGLNEKTAKRVAAYKTISRLGISNIVLKRLRNYCHMCKQGYR